MNITIQLDLPEALAAKASAKGLLSPAKLTQLIAREVAADGDARDFFEMAMKTKTVQRFFLQSEAAVVHENGAYLSEPSKGVEIFLHIRENETEPCCAEVISGEHYAEIGLLFEGKELSDYDGVFFLPREVGEMLRDAGYAVPEECFA